MKTMEEVIGRLERGSVRFALLLLILTALVIGVQVGLYVGRPQAQGKTWTQKIR